MSNRTNSNSHQTTRFYFIIALFVVTISILAVYTTMAATEYGILKDDIQAKSITHLVKSVDWRNDYENQRLGEKILQAQIDNLNITLQSSSSAMPARQSDIIYSNLLRYGSYIDTLRADKSVTGSLANLKNNAEAENSTYESSLANMSETSKIITLYELITILLIIGAGLGGIAEIAKNKLIGYPGIAVGSIGVIILLLLVFMEPILVGVPSH